MRVITPYGSAELNDIDDYDLSDEALAYLKQHKEAVELFFGNEIELTSEDAKEETYIQEIVEIVIVENKFTSPERAFALAAFLETEITDMSEEYKNEFTIFSASYLVLNEEEADEQSLESEKNILEDIGIEGLGENNLQYIYDNFVNTEWFDTNMEESNEIYAQDIRTESSSNDIYINRLHEEMVEKSIMDEPEWPDENDFADEEEYELAKETYNSELENEVENNIDSFVETLNNDYDSGLEYFKSNFGNEELHRIIKNDNLVDLDAVAQWIISLDGRGQALSAYDGVENEYSITFKGIDYDFLIYRTN